LITPRCGAGEDYRQLDKPELAPDTARAARHRGREKSERGASYQNRPPGSPLKRESPDTDRRRVLGADVCGIAGCYQQASGQRLVNVMSDRIAHRGPDAAGVWSHQDDHVSVHLAHRRLSIIDLSAAADQPLAKQGLALVYNGELYNYKELRAELAGHGVRFSTNSDTEVVLEAWRAWGAEALRRFRGMFAFALADTATGELVLARDPLGIKPLYYLPRGDGVVFASELKA